jgi:ParB-like chromosome segregation protein Spo0J
MTKTEAGRRAVKMWLAQHGKTQQWLASKLRRPESQVSRVLRGFERSQPLVDDIRDLTGVDLNNPSESLVTR